MSFIFLSLYILSYVSDMGSNYWLSNWSNNVADDKKNANKQKFYYLAVYASLGVGKGIFLILRITSSKTFIRNPILKI
jgi:hypothetical protein